MDQLHSLQRIASKQSILLHQFRVCQRIRVEFEIKITLPEGNFNAIFPVEKQGWVLFFRN